jgi:hypothetical protein
MSESLSCNFCFVLLLLLIISFTWLYFSGTHRHKHNAMCRRPAVNSYKGKENVMTITHMSQLVTSCTKQKCNNIRRQRGIQGKEIY